LHDKLPLCLGPRFFDTDLEFVHRMPRRIA
jgi:hypothetical protein